MMLSGQRRLVNAVDNSPRHHHFFDAESALNFWESTHALHSWHSRCGFTMVWPVYPGFTRGLPGLTHVNPEVYMDLPGGPNKGFPLLD